MVFASIINNAFKLKRFLRTTETVAEEIAVVGVTAYVTKELLRKKKSS